jgi:hypothetical protein
MRGRTHLASTGHEHRLTGDIKKADLKRVAVDHRRRRSRQSSRPGRGITRHPSGVEEVDGVGRHPPVAIDRRATTGPHRHLDRPTLNERGEPSDGAEGSLVAFGTPSPEPLLGTLIGPDLLSREAHQHHSRSDRARSTSPGVDLPSNPIDNRGRRQALLPIPTMLAALGVLGLDRDANRDTDTS